MNDNKILLKIINLFITLLNDNYVIIKLNPRFPNIDLGTDLDIFYNGRKDELDDIINKFKQNKFYKNLKIKKVLISNKHIQIKFFSKKSLLIIFDIYLSLPNYKVLNIRESFFMTVLKIIKYIKLKQMIF